MWLSSIIQTLAITLASRHPERVTTPPIIPGPPQPDPWQTPPVQPVYHQQPYIPPSYQPSGTPDTVKKAAIGTVTVIVTLVGLFCVLPMLICFGMAACGALAPLTPTPSP